MAKIKFTAFLADMRGKIAGTVFTKNRSGAIARTKVTPTNPQTARQLAVRAVLTGLSQAWRALTQAQRLAWNAAVRSFPRTDVFGDSKTLSGHQLYVGLNSQLSAANAAQISFPPVPAGAAAVTAASLAIVVATTTMELTFAPDPIPAGSALIIEATAPLSPGLSNVNNQFRQLQVVAAAGASPADLWAAYVAKFGAPPIGLRVFARAKIVNTATGESSNAIEASAIVT